MFQGQIAGGGHGSSTVWDLTGNSNAVSFNWHGSMPAARVDEVTFEPNFRHFDFFLDPQVPNVDLADRLYKVAEGEANWNLSHLGQYQIRACPVVISTIPGAAFCSFMYTRLLGRSGASMRWSFLSFYVPIFLWNNATKWYQRERFFMRDFQKNQQYAYDELRQQRDAQRVREALYTKQFVKDPIGEYRIKQWQVSERFA